MCCVVLCLCALLQAYSQGLSSRAVFEQLGDSDFDLMGGLLLVGGAHKPGAVPRPSDYVPGKNSANKQLFITYVEAGGHRRGQGLLLGGNARKATTAF